MPDGIIIIYKPMGLTSHDVVYKIKKMLKQKVGHTGTLDPIATGVLPVCIGQATKISQFIMSQDKKYLAEIKFGIRTNTFDITGEVLSKKKFVFDQNKLFAILNSFYGNYYQEPPMFSAIKHNGQKLYELARKNIGLELKKRLVNIYELLFLRFIPPDKILVSIKCSKGTYVRSLCNDIGNLYGCGACLSKLIRTQTGNFFISKSVTLDNFKRLYENNLLDSKIIRIQDALNLKKVVIHERAKKILYNGNKISLDFVLGEKNFADNEKLLVFDQSENLVGIHVFITHENLLKPIRMLF